MISAKFVTETMNEKTDLPDQYVVEGISFSYKTMGDHVNVFVENEDGESERYILSEDSFDKVFVMNREGHTISVIKKPKH